MEKHPGHRISADTIIHFGPPAGILLASETRKGLHLVGVPAGAIYLTPMSTRMECVRKRPMAFAFTDYKVQGRTLERVVLGR